MKPRRCTGFTLMEVLIALAVLAIAMAGLIKAMGSSASNLTYLEEKSIAQWVAANVIAEQQIADPPPAAGTRQGQETMAGRDWNWEMEATQTADKEVLRLQISVKRDGDPDTVYSHLTGYVYVPR